MVDGSIRERGEACFRKRKILPVLLESLRFVAS